MCRPHWVVGLCIAIAVFFFLNVAYALSLHRAILQLHHWQHWQLMLANQPGATEAGKTESICYQSFHGRDVRCVLDGQG